MPPGAILDRLFALETFGIKLGLANISALCAALDHPERAFASLHVAGTNGKGSVTAMAHAALRAAGVAAARYTSPHLVDLKERFVIGDEPVDDAGLAAAAARVLDAADALVADGTLPAPPTFFEATTAVAFELFRRAGVDIAVIEVGLGGRFDATNVVRPIASAITSIGFDHQQHLGDTLARIAAEKAGIIKPGIPVVAGALPAEAWTVVARTAADRGARLVRALEESEVATRLDGERSILDLRTPSHRYRPMALALRGEHQVHNAVVAIRLLEEARAAGVRLPFAAIAGGIERAVWPARLEILAFPDGRELVLDAAHNADGAATLARFLGRHRPGRPPLVFAAMRDKDVPAMLRPLLPVVGPIVVTSAPSHRASRPEELAAAIAALDAARAVVIEPEPVQAVERAWMLAPIVCVAGSMFLAGAVRGALHPHAIVGSSR